MKRIIFALIAAMTLCSLVQAKDRTVTENDSLGNKKRVIELRDTIVNGKAVTDTLSVMTYENSSAASNDEDEDWKHSSNDFNWGMDLFNIGTQEALVAIVAILSVIGLPLFIIFVILSFFFNYKNRKAQYRIAEQAIANGQQIPENFFKKGEADDIRSKGIKNIFTGIGLFILLWALTNFSIGCIGLLVMFTGFGQVVIYYVNSKPKK